MTASKEDNAALLSKCLDFCQSLSSKSLTFSFALTVTDSFSFSLATRGEVALASKAKKNKKTPSALRRNARRRAEFLKKKPEASTSDDALQSEHASVEEAVERIEKTFKCDQCQNSFKSENGLKIHAGKSHKKVTSLSSTPERLRQQVEGSVTLSASPLLDASREEFSLNFAAVEEKVTTPPSRPSTPPLPPSLNTLCKKCDEELHDYTCCDDQLELCHDCCNELRVCCYSD